MDKLFIRYTINLVLIWLIIHCRSTVNLSLIILTRFLIFDNRLLIITINKRNFGYVLLFFAAIFYFSEHKQALQFLSSLQKVLFDFFSFFQEKKIHFILLFIIIVSSFLVILHFPVYVFIYNIIFDFLYIICVFSGDPSATEFK